MLKASIDALRQHLPGPKTARWPDGERSPFVTGDALFVAAHVEHHFENFTPDFATWVVFYGPVGGEAS